MFIGQFTYLCPIVVVPLLSDVRPITPPPDDKPDREKNKSFRCGERKITVANTDLLFKLFEGVEKDIRKTHPLAEKDHVKSRAYVTFIASLSS